MSVKKFSKIIIVLLLVFALINGCSSDVESKIRKNLIGSEIEYFSISGDPLAYVVLEDEIISLGKIENGWKAKVGSELKWNMYYNKKGEFVRQEQLFQT